jgi:hypothetical protein
MRSLSMLAPVVFALAAGPALADQTYKLDKIEINGVKSVSVTDLKAGLSEKAGDTVTVDQIKADQDILLKELEKQNVTGGVKTSLRNKNNGHIDIIFDVNDTGIQKPEVKTVTRLVDPKMGRELAAGNTVLTTDQIIEAAGLKEGDVMTKESLQAAAQRIVDVFNKTLTRHGKQATLKLDIATAPTAGKSDELDLTWKMTEGKVTRKKNAGDDNGFNGSD